MGVDPAQAVDYMGIVIAEYVPWLDPVTRQCKRDIHSGNPMASLKVLHLERWKGMHYEDQIAKIQEHRRANDLDMIIGDDTGVGVGLWDMFRSQDLEECVLMRIKFTSGESERHTKKHHVNVSKSLIVSSLISFVEARRVKIAPHLKLGPQVIREAQAWRPKITQALNEVYVNQDSEHDDLVSAMALVSLVSSRIWGKRYLADLADTADIEADDDARWRTMTGEGHPSRVEVTWDDEKTEPPAEAGVGPNTYQNIKSSEVSRDPSKARRKLTDAERRAELEKRCFE